MERGMDRKVVRIKNKDSYGISWYEHAQPYLGSHKGMRFRISRNPMEDVALKPEDQKGEAVFEIIIWPEPFCFEKTPEEKKTRAEFPFNEEGKIAMIEWLNEQYEQRFDEWETVRTKYS